MESACPKCGQRGGLRVDPLQPAENADDYDRPLVHCELCRKTSTVNELIESKDELYARRVLARS